jgi:MFS family permease
VRVRRTREKDYTRHEYSLDALNFFLADVRQGLGPYLAIYLLPERHWAEDEIGLVMSIAAVSGLIVQAPAGALIDVSHAKRAIIVAAALVVTSASIILPFMSSFVFVAGSQAAAGTAEAFFGPTVAPITLGIMGPREFTRRIGRNETFNHAGNALAAALAGVLRLEVGANRRLLSPGEDGFALDRERPHHRRRCDRLRPRPWPLRRAFHVA